MSNQNTDVCMPQLTAEQWAGLATLGQVVQGLSGPLAGPATAWLTQAMAVEQREDLSGLVREVTDTASVLRDSGLLSILREQAPMLVEAIRVLGPMMTALRTVPVDEVLSGVADLSRWIKQLQALETFARDHLSGPATQWVDQMTAFGAEHEVDAALKDALVTLSHMHRNGSFARLRELSGLFADKQDGSALADIAGDGVDQLRDGIGRILRAIDQADHVADTADEGGIAGLIRMLRDPDVQHGLRLLALLPGQLRRAA